MQHMAFVFHLSLSVYRQICMVFTKLQFQLPKLFMDYYSALGPALKGLTDLLSYQETKGNWIAQSALFIFLNICNAVIGLFI